MNTQKNELTISIGAKVVFKEELTDAFIRETTGHDENLKKYQQIVLAGTSQVGVVQGFVQNLVNVSYPDRWTVPIHPKYLQVLPIAEE